MEQPKEIVNSDSPAKPPKKKLPVGTLIAAFWLIIVGLLGMFFVFSLWSIGSALTIGEDKGQYIISLILMGIFLLVIIPGILLLLKRIWAWLLALSLLFIGIVILFVLGASSSLSISILFSVLLFIPLILAFSDYQRYMEMASNKSPKSNEKKSTINIEQ